MEILGVFLFSSCRESRLPLRHQCRTALWLYAAFAAVPAQLICLRLPPPRISSNCRRPHIHSRSSAFPALFPARAAIIMGEVEAIVARLKEHADSALIQADACLALASLLSAGDASALATLNAAAAACGAPEAVAEALARHASSRDVQLAACRAIALLATDPGNCRAAGRAGAVRAAVSAARARPGDSGGPGFASACALCLAALTIRDKENAEEMRNLGASLVVPSAGAAGAKGPGVSAAVSAADAAAHALSTGGFDMRVRFEPGSGAAAGAAAASAAVVPSQPDSALRQRRPPQAPAPPPQPPAKQPQQQQPLVYPSFPNDEPPAPPRSLAGLLCDCLCLFSATLVLALAGFLVWYLNFGPGAEAEAERRRRVAEVQAAWREGR